MTQLNKNINGWSSEYIFFFSFEGSLVLKSDLENCVICVSICGSH